MDPISNIDKVFELEIELPNSYHEKLAKRVIGFRKRYERVFKHLQLLVNIEEIKKWCNKHYGRILPIVEYLHDRYPLIIFHGDVGTGKTVFAETICNQLCIDIQKDSKLFKLSTRVRGEGLVGQMSELVNRAFNIIFEAAGKKRHSFVIIDEGDSLAASRNIKYSHQEDKVGVNTLIQKIDETRKYLDRILIIICTNRFSAIDPAILRRASLIEQFDRPDDSERLQLFKNMFSGIELPKQDLVELVRITGPNDGKLGFTYSDITTRLIPEAVTCSFPDRKMTIEDIIKTAQIIQPTSSIIDD